MVLLPPTAMAVEARAAQGAAKELAHPVMTAQVAARSLPHLAPRAASHVELRFVLWMRIPFNSGHFGRQRPGRSTWQRRGLRTLHLSVRVPAKLRLLKWRADFSNVRGCPVAVRRRSYASAETHILCSIQPAQCSQSAVTHSGNER